MAITLTNTGITFPSGNAQTTKFDENNNVGALISTQYFGSTGTWTRPTGCTRIRVIVVGAGGSASGYGESGGAGGYAEKTIDVTGIASVAVTVPGQSAGVSYSAAGNDGGTSSFGAYVSASGGYGANRNSNHAGGHGGIGSGGDINQRGGGGSGHDGRGGRGGTSFFGGSKFSGWGGNSHAHQEEGNVPPGAGGFGDHTTHGPRGSYGANGRVIVYNYK